MENDYLKFIHTIFSIVQPPNSQSTDEILEEMYKYLDSISNENQLKQLQQIIDECYEKEQTQDDKKQILHQIRQSVKQKFSSINQDPSGFLNDMFNNNSKHVGVSILQNNGDFILIDQLTKKILEIKSQSEFQKRLFDYCSIAGQTNLMKQFNEENHLLEEKEVQKEFQMTIYSEKIRKKALKHLNQYAKKKAQVLNEMNSISPNLRLPQQTTQIPKFDYWEKIKIKYLKTITIKITKMNLSINKDFLDLIQNSPQLYGSQQLQRMADNPTQQYNVVKCEISENPYVEELLPVDLQKDIRIQFYEDKWNLKIQQISTEFQKIKELKEKAKFENLFQNQCNILSHDLLQDLNSQIQYLLA